MDRDDIHNTWGQLRFGATSARRIGDAPHKEFSVQYCLGRHDGSYDVWGYQGNKYQPWKLFRCRTRDGVHFEDVRVVLEREQWRWGHVGSVSYSPELGRFLLLKNVLENDGFAMYVYWSADGERWQEYERNPVFYDGDNWGALWSSAIKKFVYYGKGVQRYNKRIPELFANARRVVTLRTSPDGFHWTPDAPSFWRRNMRSPEGIDFGQRQVEGQLVPVEYQISPDEQDPPDLEFYACRAFAYEGRYYLKMSNYAASWIPPGTPPVHADGHGPTLDTEWWISRDGTNWQRPFRHIDAGEVFLHHNPMIIGGKLLFHAGNGLWAIPEDRITYVTARANGVFDTALFRTEGRPLKLNARLPGDGYSSNQEQAYTMTELVDEVDRVFPGYEKDRCILQGPLDAPDIPLRWKDRDGSELAGKKMRLRFYLRAADIFAVTA